MNVATGDRKPAAKGDPWLIAKRGKVVHAREAHHLPPGGLVNVPDLCANRLAKAFEEPAIEPNPGTRRRGVADVHSPPARSSMQTIHAVATMTAIALSACQLRANTSAATPPRGLRSARLRRPCERAESGLRMVSPAAARTVFFVTNNASANARWSCGLPVTPPGLADGLGLGSVLRLTPIRPWRQTPPLGPPVSRVARN